jgi:hypothetical protein
MITPFECWNGGSVRWNGLSLPEFVFSFPPADRDLVAFLQLSGRICEVLTQCLWLLNVGGQPIEVPELPAEEVNALALAIEEQAGYVPVVVPYQPESLFAAHFAIPLILWANVVTGRADMFSPATGLVLGHQLLDPREHPSGGPAYAAAADSGSVTTPEETFQGVNSQSLLQSFSAMAGASSRIDEFLSASGADDGFSDVSSDNLDYSAYDPQARFEEDSAGWPGGAYQNPDSGHYEPGSYDDYSTSTSYDDY